MNIGRTVFAQLMDFVPGYEFRQCVERYRGNYKVKTFFLLGSVSLYGLRLADLSGKSPGYRSLPAYRQDQALSHGDSGQGLQKYSGAGARERDSRLENLRRLCPSPDQNRERVVRGREFRTGTQADRLCTRCHNYRPLPLRVPSGIGQSSTRARLLLLEIRENEPVPL